MSAAANAAAAELHVHRIIGPTILMGDGSYFDYEAPETTTMTIEDYAWGLAANNRFCGQTWWDGRRCLYNVCQHVVLLAEQMLRDGHTPRAAFGGLGHESGEVPWGDLSGPAKPLVPDYKAREKLADTAIRAHFGFAIDDPDLVKAYDIRMLATEKRDLMPQGRGHQWKWTEGFEPFDFAIVPWSADYATTRFLALYHYLREGGL